MSCILNAFTRLPEEKQLHILDAATECFAEKGYYGASIKEICHKANISNGALYKYFGSKEKLFLAVLNRCQHILVNHLYRKHTHITHSFFTTVHSYLKEIERLHIEYPNYIKVYANLGSNNMENFSQELHDSFMESGTYVLDMVAEAKERNEIEADIDEKMFSFLLDNYFILFLYSLVSDYHEKRFRSFLRIEKSDHLTNKEKINFILDSIRILSKDNKQ